MNILYELKEDDIRYILSEKFNCKPECVCIRSEKEYVSGGTKETIKATVKTEAAK